MKRYLIGLSLAVTLVALPGLALAHIGVDAGGHHGSGFEAGFGHPFTGLDHLCAMIAVGIWSAMTARRAWLAPAAFAGMLGIGAVLGMGGLALPVVEPVVAASLLVIGLLVAARITLPAAAGLGLVGAFALFHGFAHGTELVGAAALAGMLLGTMTLHASGIAIGLLLKSRDLMWSRALGSLVALIGVGLLSGAI